MLLIPCSEASGDIQYQEESEVKEMTCPTWYHSVTKLDNFTCGELAFCAVTAGISHMELLCYPTGMSVWNVWGVSMDGCFISHYSSLSL